MAKQVNRLERNDDLVRAARTDAEALGRLYELYYERIFRFCIYRLFNKEIAEDVTSTIFLEVAHRIRRFEDRTEQDFIESLRVWAEVMRDGTFPDAIGTESAMKIIPTLVQKLSQMQVSDEEETRIGTSFGKGMLFHQMLENQGGEWHYAGAGVKLGDAGKPIFWYQPQGSQTYRVIYGDLTVKDVAPDDLPK